VTLSCRRCSRWWEWDHDLRVPAATNLDPLGGCFTHKFSFQQAGDEQLSTVIVELDGSAVGV
jgi:hypothetical protein